MGEKSEGRMIWNLQKRSGEKVRYSFLPFGVEKKWVGWSFEDIIDCLKSKLKLNMRDFDKVFIEIELGSLCFVQKKDIKNRESVNRDLQSSSPKLFCTTKKWLEIHPTWIRFFEGRTQQKKLTIILLIHIPPTPSGRFLSPRFPTIFQGVWIDDQTRFRTIDFSGLKFERDCFVGLGSDLIVVEKIGEVEREKYKKRNKWSESPESWLGHGEKLSPKRNRETKL